MQSPKTNPEGRPPAPPPAWDGDADAVLVDGMAQIFVAILVLGLVRVLASWLMSKPAEDAELDGTTTGPEPTEQWEAHACRLPAKLGADDKAAVLASVSLKDRSAYFQLSCCPVTEQVEQRMEQISGVVCKENYNDHWETGRYLCARCGHALYSSSGKFVGPCLWPSFRKGRDARSLHTIEVPRGSYNQYTCDVQELYCGGCQLFLGHRFADGKACGDTHVEAHWRHCVLSLSLTFIGEGAA